MILVTGDIHGKRDISKLDYKLNPDFEILYNKIVTLP